MERSTLECSVDGNGVSQMAGSWNLRVKDENLSGRIVVEGKGPPLHLLRALGALAKTLIDRAAAVDDDAGPRSGICHVILPSQRKGGNAKKRHHAYQRTLCHASILP